MKKIALIGAGQLGSRHLQALALLDFPVKIFVIDPFQKSLEVARSRFDEVNETSLTKNEKEICYAETMGSLPDEIDIAIIATNADGRLEIIENLLSSVKVSHLILEKVVFNEMAHFSKAHSLFNEKKCNVYVNCTRRMFDIYQKLNEMLSSSRIIEFVMEGTKWDIGSNGIHSLDLFSYLSGEEVDDLSPAFFDEGIVLSSRDGYNLFHGTVTGRSKGGGLIRLSSLEEGMVQGIHIRIFAEDIIIDVDETKGIATLKERDNGWIPREISFSVPFQSQLTNLLVEDLISNATCQLTPFDQCIENHKRLIKVINNHLGLPQDHKCPIT